MCVCVCVCVCIYRYVRTCRIAKVCVCVCVCVCVSVCEFRPPFLSATSCRQLATSSLREPSRTFFSSEREVRALCNLSLNDSNSSN